MELKMLLLSRRIDAALLLLLLLLSLLWEGSQAWTVMTPIRNSRPITRPPLLGKIPTTTTENHFFRAESQRMSVAVVAAAAFPRKQEGGGAGGGRRRREISSTYVATCIPGLSKILAQELMDLGCNPDLVETTGNSAVRFSADARTILQVLIWARTPHKIMELLCESPPELVMENRNDLYSFVRNTIPMKQILGDGKGGLLTLSVSTTLNNAPQLPTDINHSHYTALTIKNAIVDAVRDLRGDRPNVDIENPDLPLVAVLRGNSRGGDDDSGGAQLSLFRQIHYGSLHKRGYRSSDSAIHKAAMKESLASGLLLSAQWLPKVHQHLRERQNGVVNVPPLVLVDPMAGSGTLILEALFMAADVAPHVLRLKCGLQPLEAQQYPPIIRWKKQRHDDDDGGVMDMASLWKELLLDASERAKAGLRNLRGNDNNGQPPIYFLANDAHSGALNLLQESLEYAGVKELVQIYQSSCQDFVPKLPTTATTTTTTTAATTTMSSPWTVVCNPPWGIRLNDDMSEAWEQLRFFLRNTCPEGTVAHVLSGNPEATKHLGLRRSSSVPIQVGNVHMRWITYLMQKPTARSGGANNKNNNINGDSMGTAAAGNSQGEPLWGQFHKHTNNNNNNNIYTKNGASKTMDNTFGRRTTTPNGSKKGATSSESSFSSSKRKGTSSSSDDKKRQAVSQASSFVGKNDWLLD